MSQPGSSQLKLGNYSLEVIRLDGVRKGSNKGQLYVEVNINETTNETIGIGDDGKPTSDATLTFSQPGSSTVFDISLRQSRKNSENRLLGHVRIEEDVLKLLQESLPYERKCGLTGTARSVFGRRRTVIAGTIHLCLNLVDEWERAEFCVTVADRRVEDIRTWTDKVASTDSVIGCIIKGVDQLFEIVDTVVQAASTLYKVICQQFRRDAKLVDLVEKMKEAFHFSIEARSLDDRTETLLRTRLKIMLHETAKCSRFVQRYASHSFAGRIIHWTESPKIDEFTARFASLKKELDSIIIVIIGLRPESQQMLQTLQMQLELTSMDISKVSARPRCLEGTRKDYVERIMSRLFPDSETDQNIVWLTGAAGSGKSTIAVTISDACDERGYPAAYLFFERGKDEYISAIRAIAYRVAVLHPSVRPHIVNAVKDNSNSVGSSLKTQFQRLLLDPLKAVVDEIKTSVVIILDALDECGTSSQREDLVHLLKNDFASLPAKVHILVTSRPESDIMENPMPCHIHHIDLEHRSDESRHDVDLYLKKKMVVVVKQGTPKGWEWDRVCGILSESADGLFIWASTVIKMVGESNNPRRKLRTLLDDVQSVGGGIDGLYASVLERSGIPWHEAEARDEFVRILGAVLFAKEALSGGDIEAFLGIEEDTADTILGRLRSVLFYEAGKPVRLHHVSFADYLTSERSGGKPWNIEESGMKQAIVERCFDIMQKGLRFNICGLESSFLRNDEVPGLQGRIEKEIPPHLDYACQFWAVHLCELSFPASLVSKLKAFVNGQLLYWFEVLSLTKHYNRVAVGALYNVSLKTASVDTDASSFVWAAYKLASVFAYPISQSVPQIYLSAVSLWRGESLVAEHYSKSHPIVEVHRCGKKPPAQCIKILQGHTYWVTSVIFSPDGKRIASSSGDYTVRVWDVDSGEVVSGPFEGHTSWVRSVAFSPDGKRVASGSGDFTIRIWDVDRGALALGPLEGHTGEIWSVAFSPDGRRIASGSADKTIRIWCSDSGKLVVNPSEGHLHPVISVVFSPHGKYIASGSDDKTVRVWDAESGKLVAEPFEAHTDEIWSVDFSHDGRRIVSGSKDMSICVWDALSGKLLTRPIEGHTNYVRSVVFSPDGSRIASGSYDNTIRVWDSFTGEIVAGPFKGHSLWVLSVAFSPDGMRIASGSADHTIRIWDAESGTFALDKSQERSGPVKSVSFSPDGKRIASGSDDCTIRVWDTESGELVSGPFEGHTDWVYSVAFSPDGKLIASGSGDDTVCVWDAGSGELTSQPFKGHTGLVFSVTFSPDGRLVASGSVDKTICVWDTDSGELVAGPITGHTNNINSVSFSPDGRFIASGSSDETVRVWDVGSGKVVSGPFVGHSGTIWSVMYSPGGKHIASGSADKTIRVWDVESGELLLDPFGGHTGEVNSVTFSPDGKYISSGSDDKSICIWVVDSGELVLGPFRGHSDLVHSVAFSPDGKRVASSSRDGTIRIWEVDSIGLQALTSSSERKHASVTFPHRSSHIDEGDIISSWTMSEDGWTIGSRGELLTWIPEDMRLTLLRHPENIAVIGQGYWTSLDLANSPLGEDWCRGFLTSDEHASAGR
ncbi:WD40 repeat-like protein [Sanghuangporus baumii]|uniref:WD40 repeat-like protein n=1 Tax=Sanghuangporus baumii TaxID=108892 RepID=A0A9Q5HSF8_SANBA|nr:WD40 repeat-like protein [Sanghuangporus baumii]